MKSRDRKGAQPPAIESARGLGDGTVRRRHLLVGLGLCLLTLAAYSNSFGAGFAMDNRGLILQDARVHAATAENLGLIFGHTYWWPYGERRAVPAAHHAFLPVQLRDSGQRRASG